MAGIKTFVFDHRFVLLSLAASLTLHLVLAKSVLGKNRSKPPQREKLVVELIGMVSNRQLEQEQRGEPNPNKERKTAATPPQKVVKKTAKQAIKTAPKAQSRMKVKAQEEHTKPDPKPKQEQKEEHMAVKPALPANGNSTPSGSESQQVQQTLKPRESEANLIRKYLGRLKRDIQNHLDYPEEAQDTGNVGAPTIRFTITESGGILPGSLSINKSSGSAQLDQQALRAALSSAPLAKPPRQMTVTIKVAFTQDG